MFQSDIIQKSSEFSKLLLYTLHRRASPYVPKAVEIIVSFSVVGCN